MFTIRVDQSLSDNAMYEHRCLEIINRLYKSARRYDDLQQYKAIIEAAITSTPMGFTENSQISHSQYVTVKNPKERKSLRHFLDTLEVKPKTAVRRFCFSK